MSEPENLRTVQRIYQAFIEGNLPAVLNLMTDDVEMLPPVSRGGSAVVGWGRPWRGRRGAEEYLGLLAEALEFLVFQPDEFIVARDTVVVLGHERCRVRATGRIVEANWVQIFTLRDGIVSRHREYSDTAAWEAGYADREK